MSSVDDDDDDDEEDDDDVEVSRSDASGVARSDALDVSRSDTLAVIPSVTPQMFWIHRHVIESGQNRDLVLSWMNLGNIPCRCFRSDLACCWRSTSGYRARIGYDWWYITQHSMGDGMHWGMRAHMRMYTLIIDFPAASPLLLFSSSTASSRDQLALPDLNRER